MFFLSVIWLELLFWLLFCKNYEQIFWNKQSLVVPHPPIVTLFVLRKRKFVVQIFLLCLEMTSFQFFVMFQSVIALTFAELFYKVSFGMPEKWDLGTETWDPYLGPSNQDPATRMNKQDPKPVGRTRDFGSIGRTWNLGPRTWNLGPKTHRWYPGPKNLASDLEPRTHRQEPRTHKQGLGPGSFTWDYIPGTLYMGTYSSTKCVGPT